MGLIYNKALDLTEREVRYAIENTRNNREAAEFCGCAIDTWRRYAKMYFDYETGLSLYDLHVKKGRRRSRKDKVTGESLGFKKKDIFEILEGKHPSYNPKKLAYRLLYELIFPPECCECGFSERRVTDQKLPLVMNFKDGDKRNFKKENLEFVCYNCYFLTRDDISKCKFPRDF